MGNQDPMIDIYIYEAQQLLETLEDILLEGEKEHRLTDEQINEVFRIMHTIKGSSGMMSFEGLTKISHTVEDLFSQIREKKARSGDWDNIFDIVLAASDLIKADIDKISLGQNPDCDPTEVMKRVGDYLDKISHRVAPAEEAEDVSEEALVEDEDTAPDAPYYKIKISFEAGCQMENMRAFGVANELHSLGGRICHVPENLMDESASAEIAEHGLIIYMQTSVNPDTLKSVLDSTMFLAAFSVISLAVDSEELPAVLLPPPVKAEETVKEAPQEVQGKQNFISVNVNKIDKLMDLVGEIVTTESMVTKNPEVVSLQLESFERSGQQLRKLINELQDIVMSVRMLPVSTTFHKMHRIVRDMSKKVGREVNLTIIGEETEVDKNIIDHLSDPLMHLIRNSVDHGLEPPGERTAAGKRPAGTVTLEARNTGGDVTITVSDDGRGLDRESIVRKAIERGVTSKSPEEITDKEAYSYIFLPGFSTNEQVTEFSGRGVGMDVVRSNIEKVGGSVLVDSTPGKGTTVQIKIPLTLAIIEGMKLSVGDLTFIVPILSIQESFKPEAKDVFLDPDGNEMIMLRGECYSVLRLHHLFNIVPETENPEEGILIRITNDTHTYCLFADKLLGEQQAVVKPLPLYIQQHNHNMRGLGGCAILGDGSISLIVDVNTLNGEMR
ncbi:MAG: chemotaxis protein CheA [Firmicutes bacterium]|nr:chemotaxis protein CheA [Bacillota bacterium]